jgi:bifunctional DNA-binding transcriptional regulator/antitoxin component of YhaV-PrlF toxin-antitoxin module
MAKIKESHSTYSSEPITTVTTRGKTEIPRALRERYHVTAKSRLRWVDTGKGLLIVPVEQPVAVRGEKRKIREKTAAHSTAKKNNTEGIRPENLEAIAFLRKWMEEPDDWTYEQWDEFEQELRSNRLHLN